MGQIIDNLNNINKIMPEEASGIVNKHSHNDNLSAKIAEKDMDSLLGYKFTREKKDGYLENTTMKNFDEYLKNRQEKQRQAGLDAASEEKKEKENEKEVARNLSSEEIKRLKLMGVDVEGASMSDLLGMVNTMRHNVHREEQTAMMAQIALSDGDTDGMTVAGGAVKLNGVKIDADVMDVKLAESEDMKTDDKTVLDSGKEESGQDNTADKNIIGNNEIIYLLHNDMPVTEDNLYKAHFSGTRINNEASVTDEMFKEMQSQIEKVIAQAGFDVDDESLEDARLLINNDIPVTTDNVRRYEELKEYIGKDAGEIINAVTEKEAMVSAEKLMQDIEAVSPDLVYDMAKNGKEVTIAAAVRELTSYKENENESAKTVNAADIKHTEYLSAYERDMEAGTLDAKAVTARRQMEEIRLSMTMEVSLRMTSLDVNIDTRELSRFVNVLRDIEKKLLGDTFKQAGVELNDDSLLTYNEFISKVNDIADAPANILATPLRDGAFSVNSLHIRAFEAKIEFEGAADTAKSGGSAAENAMAKASYSFETVARSYEAVGTAPRADMGDSISKAFRNVSDILESMDMPVNYETGRAVRILGYNRMEITESNITEVMNYDRQVNELINNLYPEAVLGMIKDNINPLDASIEDLNKTIRAKRYNEGVSEAEDFASYLRDMEAKGEVSAEERESYIGIYRMMNRLAKSGDREAGWLFANSSRLTVRNLLAAARSRRSAGVDVSVNDEFGMLSELSTKGSRIDRQIESAFRSGMDTAPDNEEAIVSDIERFNALSEEVTRFIKENDIEFSMVNAFAADSMINTSGGIYQLVSELLAGMKFDADNKDNLVDEETENMTDSMSGEDIGIDIAQFETDSILESLRSGEEMSLKYDDLRNQITEMMYRAGAQGRIGSLDISSIKTISAGFNIMSSMAKKEHFRIPVKTDEGINVINLSIEHDEINRGSISISMSKTAYGNISADIRVTGDKHLYGQIISDTSEGNVTLANSFAEFADGILQAGFNAEGISFGSIRKGNAGLEEQDKNITMENSGQTDAADEKTIYEAAVSLVKGLAKISG